MPISNALKSILDQGLVAQYGIVIRFPTAYDARYQRRRLYAAREKLRLEGFTLYDSLSFIIRNKTELMLVHRSALLDTNTIGFLECRELTAREMPGKILSRGKSRLGIGISSLFIIIQSFLHPLSFIS